MEHLFLIFFAFFLVAGLKTSWLFMEDGNPHLQMRLVEAFEGGAGGGGMCTFPEGVDPLDVAGVLKKYLAMLPEPLLTFR
jgi:hypothetical protein